MMDAHEIALFTKSIEQAVTSGADLDELGWSEALEVSPAIAVSALFTAQGAAATTSSALHRVLAAALGVADPVLLPPLDRRDPPGTLVDDRVQVSGLTASLETSHVLVFMGNGEAVRVATGDLVLRPVRGLDPAFDLVEVSGDVPVVPEAVSGSWAAAVALGHRALATELVGTGRTMLELARVHALDRVQFGRPISGFQAVRHRLADTLVALESADDLIAASWEDDSPVLAAMAKAVAGRAARTAARHCQQVLAGIGFTTEHSLHKHVRRTLLLDQLLGSSRTLTRDLGNDLLATRRLPALLPL